MSENEEKISLYIVSRESVVEARRMLEQDPQAEVFLVGRGLVLPVKMFGNRKIYALKEEAESMGVGDKTGDNLELVDAGTMIDIIAERRVYSFS